MSELIVYIPPRIPAYMDTIAYSIVVSAPNLHSGGILGSIPGVHRAFRPSEVGKLVPASAGGEKYFVRQWGACCSYSAVLFIILLMVCSNAGSDHFRCLGLTFATILKSILPNYLTRMSYISAIYT